MDITTRTARNAADRDAALKVRRLVFIEEQRVPEDIERDAYDATAVHVVAEVDGRVVATGRLVTEGARGRIGRMAVLPGYRRQGIAGRVLQALEDEARRLGMAHVALHAQSYVQALYARHGYRVDGSPFVEAGITHVSMVKTLGPAAPDAGARVSCPGHHEAHQHAGGHAWR